MNILFQYSLIPVWGLSGVAVLLVGSVITALGYMGSEGERFSPLNHFISELGQRSISRIAWLFNISLMLGGLLLGLFMLQLGFYIGSIMSAMAALVGVFSAISCLMVGVLTMDDMKKHMRAANCFFYGGMLTQVLFAIAIAKDTYESLPSFIIIFSIVVIVTFLVFLISPMIEDRQKAYSTDPTKGRRPTLWWFALLEWMVMMGMLGWVVAVSIYLVIS